jgi:CubicO group peptidase (beta-lactamase class C family)
VRNGEVVKAKGYGLANVELNVPASAETVYQSGSTGKQFTATAVMMLVEDGKLALDDKINKYFPDSPESWNNITIRHLLTHTSGTTDYPKDFDFRRDYTEAELLKKAQLIPLAFAPGEKWSYSNLGYVTLGILVSKVAGKFYGDFLQERIFRPLGMSTARIINESDIVMTNRAGANPGLIAHGIAGLYNPDLTPLEHKEAQVDPKVFDNYVGEYELAPGFTLIVTRDADKLWLQPTGQPRIQIFPESESSFFLKVADAQVTFVKDAAGKVTHLILHQAGDQEAKRIK